LSILCDAVYRDVMYDADLKNKRDSAYELEDELFEWARLGPIEDTKLLLSDSSSATMPPTRTQEVDDEPLYNPDISYPSENDDDPMRPRP
jgi:hypothetical protein